MLYDGRYADISQMTKRQEKRNENFFLSRESKKKTCQMKIKNLIGKVRYICLNETVLLERYHVDGVCMKLKPLLNY